MQHLDLKPTQLAALAQGNATEAVTIEYDDAQAALLSPSASALALLARNEYVLVMALLRQRALWQESPGSLPFGLSIDQLMALVKSTSQQSVERQLQRAALKVASLGIHIYPLHGMRQYFVLYRSEVQSPQRGAAAESLPFNLIR